MQLGEAHARPRDLPQCAPYTPTSNDPTRRESLCALRGTNLGSDTCNRQSRIWQRPINPLDSYLRKKSAPPRTLPSPIASFPRSLPHRLMPHLSLCHPSTSSSPHRLNLLISPTHPNSDIQCPSLPHATVNHLSLTALTQRGMG